MNAIRVSVVYKGKLTATDRKAVITVNDDKKIYDCKTCPYITYKDGLIYFCNNCVRKIIDEQDKRKEKDNGR